MAKAKCQTKRQTIIYKHNTENYVTSEMMGGVGTERATGNHSNNMLQVFVSFSKHKAGRLFIE